MIDRRMESRLREARTARGWTQAELAQKAGVSRKTINTVENGVFTPSTTLALVLGQVLGEPVERLFRLVDDNDPPPGQGQ